MAIPIGEALLAVTGITQALRPGPVRINQEVMGKARGLEKTIQRKIRHFVRDKTFAEQVDPPPFDYDEVISLLPGADQEARNVENVTRFPDQGLAEAYAQTLGTAIGYIQGHMPAEVLPAMVGSKNMTPGDLDVSEFQRRYQILDRPTLLLDDLCAGPLVPDQVETLEAVYPGIYGFIRETMMREMVEAGTWRVNFELPYEKDQALQVLLQTDTLTPGLHDELTKTFEAARERESGQKADGTPSSQPARKGIGDPSTQQERLESK